MHFGLTMDKFFQNKKQKLSTKKCALLTVITLIIFIGSGTTIFLYHQQITNNFSKPTYLGVSFCGNTTTEAKILIDKVKDYTNLFVLQSGPVSYNMTSATEICDYATSQGLNIRPLAKLFSIVVADAAY